MPPDSQGATAAPDARNAEGADAPGEPGGVTIAAEQVEQPATPPASRARRSGRSNNAAAATAATAPSATGTGVPADDTVEISTADLASPPEELATEAPTPEPATRKVRRARRVKRVIRRIELWSVLKLALVLYTCMYVVVMGALVIVWGFAYSAGLVDNFESFANDVGFENWQFYGDHMFRQAAVIGGVLVVTFTVLTVLATALVNVVSELTGGIRVVVIEEDIAFVPLEPAPTDGDPSAVATGRRRSRRG